MRILDLFSGIGGFSLAGEWVGWETVAFCEIDKFCQEYLKINFPNIPIHGDIKTTDFTVYRGQCDIICGGDPCQPSSVAGKRQGKADTRYLWPEKFRAIVESQAGIVVNENVTGTISNGLLDQKISDLESAGYTCWPPFVIPASAVGAWHRRDRVWLIAYNSNFIRYGEKDEISTRRNGIISADKFTSNATGERLSKCRLTGIGKFQAQEGERMDDRPEQHNINAPDTKKQGLEGQNTEGQSCSNGRTSQCDRGRQWQENWYEAATRLCTLDDGIPGGLVKPKGWRVNALKACGNAIVPQIVFEIFKSIDHYIKSNQ